MLDSYNEIFIVGIKGVGMANLALILKKMGKNVSGADVDEEFITDKWLKKYYIHVASGFNPHNLPIETDLVIYSAAHGGSENAIVLEANSRGITVMHQAQFLSHLMSFFNKTIAVTGSHGKTTTTALLTYALLQLGAKPSYFIGSSEFNGYPAGDFNSREYFVVEADEYGVDPPKNKTPKFKFLHPEIILCTNIDFDHPDIFDNLSETKKAFSNFFKQGKKVILSDRLKITNRKVDQKGSYFKYRNKEFSLRIYGEKNIQNAAGVIEVLLELGFKMDGIKKAIDGFTGAKRRFELKYSHNGTYLFDDYAHHPEEIIATLNAARFRFPGKRIIVIFQSHTYSRTQKLLKEFKKALSKADLTFVLPIFSSARENPEDFNVSYKDMVSVKNVKAIDSKEKLLRRLMSEINQGDVIFVMGAGDVYKLVDDIIGIIMTI